MREQTHNEEIDQVSPQSLEVLVGEWLRQRDLKLVAAESCTGGLIGHRLTNVPGSSDYYLGSVTAYAYEAKEKLLGVDHDTLAEFGAVSEEVALEMARGVRQSLGGHFPIDQLIGVSVTGIAGPGGAMPGKPVGLVWIGLSAPGLERAWQYTWQGSRIANKQLSAQQALQLVLDYLQGKLTRNNEETHLKKGEPMELEAVNVSARWNLDGFFEPSQFQWRGQVFRVESTGRSWEDESGLHILCMAHGKVFELVFRMSPAGWWLHPPANWSAVA